MRQIKIFTDRNERNVMEMVNKFTKDVDVVNISFSTAGTQYNIHYSVMVEYEVDTQINKTVANDWEHYSTGGVIYH